MKKKKYIYICEKIAKAWRIKSEGGLQVLWCCDNELSFSSFHLETKRQTEDIKEEKDRERKSRTPAVASRRVAGVGPKEFASKLSCCKDPNQSIQHINSEHRLFTFIQDRANIAFIHELQNVMKIFRWFAIGSKNNDFNEIAKQFHENLPERFMQWSYLLMNYIILNYVTDIFSIFSFFYFFFSLARKKVTSLSGSTAATLSCSP